MAHSRRKFFELHASNKSQIASQALSYISALYDVEREVKPLSIDERLHIRQTKSKPLADALYQWMVLQRRQITDGTATAKAIDYSLKRWGALTRFVDDGQLPIDNNWAENQIRPIAIGRKNWLFAGSLRAGQRAAAVMSLIQCARLNGHDPYAYLKDVLQRLPTHKKPSDRRTPASSLAASAQLTAAVQHASTVSTCVCCALTFYLIHHRPYLILGTAFLPALVGGVHGINGFLTVGNLAGDHKTMTKHLSEAEHALKSVLASDTDEVLKIAKRTYLRLEGRDTEWKEKTQSANKLIVG